MKIADLIRTDHIKVPLEAADRDSAIDELVELLAASGAIESPDDVRTTVHERERVYSTAMGAGFAFPHNDRPCPGVGTTCIAIGKFSQPIHWDSSDRPRTLLVILFLHPPRDVSAGHRAQFMASLARILFNEKRRARLLKADDAGSIRNAIVGIDADLDIPAGFTLFREFGRHPDVIHSLTWSPDGFRMASSGAGNDNIRIWDVESGRCLGELPGHRGSVYCVTWSPGNRSAACNAVGKLK